MSALDRLTTWSTCSPASTTLRPWSPSWTASTPSWTRHQKLEAMYLSLIYFRSYLSPLLIFETIHWSCLPWTGWQLGAHVHLLQQLLDHDPPHELLQLHPGHDTKKLVSLDFETSEAMELPLVWLLSTSLSMAWEARPSGKRLQLHTFRSEVEARIVFLKKTKWKHYTLHNSAVLLEELINLHL